MDQGGPCQNCGHYPAKHEEVGRDESREISREIAAFLIKPEMLEYHFKIGEGSFGEGMQQQSASFSSSKWHEANRGFFTVFKGALWGKDIAIKKVKGLKLNPHQRLEFLKEIKIMASLRHPNVILWIGFDVLFLALLPFSNYL
jgi:serine/threonine protein kinase